MRKVYLIRGNDNRYKIGISVDPRKRLKQLQTGNHDELTIIHTYESVNASKIETTLHNRYSHARKIGEWFDMSLSDELVFLENCKTIDQNINLLKSMGNCFI
jgi:hypothetical protein